jgi:Caspase domain
MGLLLRSTVFLFLGFASLMRMTPAVAQDSVTGERIKERRIALLIANSKYNDSIGSLRTPANDVSLMADVLKKLGFDVTVQSNLGLVPLRRSVADYAKRLREAGPQTVGFFYYAGHGAAASSLGPNYLIPVDASFDGDDIGVVSERLESIIDSLGEVGNSVMQFVVFDACRNILKRAGERGGERGFVPVPQRRGMVILFSTAARDVALDEFPKGSSNSPFAAKFAERLERSGQREDSLLTDVQGSVHDFTGGRQSPYVVRSPVREFYFNAAAPAVEAASAASGAPGSSATPKPVAGLTVSEQIEGLLNSGQLGGMERDQLSAMLGRLRSVGGGKLFSYYAAGDLLPGSGDGVMDATDYAPHGVFPLEGPTAYVNSQIFGYGGGGWSGKGSPGGAESDPRNYGYPWRDNFCEFRGWKVPACPSGTGHQGVDIRPATYKADHWRMFAIEDGSVEKLLEGAGAVKVVSADKQRRWTYIGHVNVARWAELGLVEGRPVKAGDALGVVANTMGGQPRSTTLHLHLQLAVYDAGQGL